MSPAQLIMGVRRTRKEVAMRPTRHPPSQENVCFETLSKPPSFNTQLCRHASAPSDTVPLAL
jgi:hypothetical protein